MMRDLANTVVESEPPTELGAQWDYAEAFSRNLGLISPEEQETLRDSCVAIPGMGGVGGVHLMTLTRLGIGSFRIADPDEFELANFNRQYGADTGTIGRSKAEAMAEKALSVNPELNIEVFRQPITERNVDSFLEGANLVVDGVDFFAIDARRKLFAAARERGLWGLTAGPLGFGTAWLTFSPDGMSFDEYFDFRDGMESLDQTVAFTVGVAPSGIHWPYFDLSQVDRESGRGPSAGLACHLASGVVAAEAIKILLRRGDLWPVPHYSHFDAYRRLLKTGKLRGGNRHPMQRIKRFIFRRQLIKHGFAK